MKKRKSPILKAVAGLIFISVILTVGISYTVSVRLSHPKRMELNTNPEERTGLKYEDVEFKSGGNTIRGWYIPSKENRFTVVYAHGYGGNRENESLSTYDVIPKINEMGGNFLSFDFSGEGQSEGEMVTVGYREQRDLKSAVEYAYSKSSAPVITYGISMGAATNIIVSSNSANIAGAIADSPFSNLKTYLSGSLGKWTHLPKYPFQPIILSMEEHLAGVKLDKVNPAGEVEKLKIPMLIIHGRGDDIIPYTESVKIAHRNRNKIKLIIMDNKGHCNSLKSHKRIYLENIGNFIEKVIDNEKSGKKNN